MEPVFGLLKDNLRFTRFSVRGKWKVKNEVGLALMVVNLRKFTTISEELYGDTIKNREIGI
ncbi:transposase [Lysinibacillus sp. ZYM-1]|uniref:transposase n=1 Tax=Lysinibacillus sp. ZYM-1 TaxID=1681184 RepID=UPI001E35432D|nr:transposase [Lysinibacillus sp. ZYM-1]